MADYNITEYPDCISVNPSYQIDTDYYEVAFTYDPEKHSFFDFMDKTHPASQYKIDSQMMLVLEDGNYTSAVVYIAKMKGTTRVFINNLTEYDDTKGRMVVMDKNNSPSDISIIKADGTTTPAQVIFGKY